MADIASIKGGNKKGKGDSASDKAVKFRLTKEQNAYVHELVRLENRIAVCREYIALWMGFFRFFAEDLTQKEITANDEKAFFQAMTQIARKHFMFVELMGTLFERGNDIINVLAAAVSLSTIQTMQENTRSKLELDWHSLFLDMNKALGRLIRELPGDLPLAQALEKVEKAQPIGITPAGTGGPAARSGLTTGAKKKKAAILAFPPMGMLGLDCFYLGKPLLGILRLITGGGFVIWALIDFVRILTGKVSDSTGADLA
jgi:hypothetical protein